MDVNIHIYVDVQSLRTSDGESYSSVESRCGEIQMRRNTVRRETLRMFFLVLYNQLTISIGKLIILKGSWFKTIRYHGTLHRMLLGHCKERYREP